jgi:hypothetical protein
VNYDGPLFIKFFGWNWSEHWHDVSIARQCEIFNIPITDNIHVGTGSIDFRNKDNKLLIQIYSTAEYTNCISSAESSISNMPVDDNNNP